MVIQSNFEVTISSLQRHNSDGMSTTTWQPIVEHNPPYSNPTGQDQSVQKYIGIATTTDLERQHHYEFAIDFKVHCGFTFIDGDDTEYLVFRTYLDDIKIGSAFVKRERWERSGTYRVRKKGRRFWVDELQGWVHKPWAFDSGLHGMLKVEVWRETDRPASSGSWDHPDFFSEGNIYDSGNAVVLSEVDGGLPKLPRVRHTRKVDMWPMATFVYEYRSEDTLKILGVTQQPGTMQKPTIDLTQADDDPSTDGPSSALTTTNASDGVWSHYDSSNATSDVMNDVVDQHMEFDYKNQQLEDIVLSTDTDWNFSPGIPDQIDCQGYREASYARAEVPMETHGVKLQETQDDIGQRMEIDFVDLTMLD